MSTRGRGEERWELQIHALTGKTWSAMDTVYTNRVGISARDINISPARKRTIWEAERKDRSGPVEDGVCIWRTEPDFHFFEENPKLQDAERRHQAPQELAGNVRTEKRQAVLHEQKLVAGAEDASLRGCSRSPREARISRTDREPNGVVWWLLLQLYWGWVGHLALRSAPAHRPACGGGAPRRVCLRSGLSRRLWSHGFGCLLELCGQITLGVTYPKRASQPKDCPGLGHACGDYRHERILPLRLLRAVKTAAGRAVLQQKAKDGHKLSHCWPRVLSAGLRPSAMQTNENWRRFALRHGAVGQHEHLQPDLGAGFRWTIWVCELAADGPWANIRRANNLFETHTVNRQRLDQSNRSVLICKTVFLFVCLFFFFVCFLF